MATRRAAFLDRDGVLIRDVDFLTRPDQVDLFEYSGRAIQRLRASGCIIVVVSNQTVVARGLTSERVVDLTHQKIQELLGNSGDAEIDRFYFCPHHPEAPLPEYRTRCDCRKPNPGMLLRAAQELNLDLPASYMVGDRLTDIIAGRRAGCRTILVETGHHLDPVPGLLDKASSEIQPDYVCLNLAAAVDDVILAG